jgi:hypothetical protein
MSKEKARRRAEDRARKRAPKTKAGTRTGTDQPVVTTGKSAPPSRPAKARRMSAREQRRRRRIWIIAIAWLVANGLIWAFTDTWNARWLGLTFTTILIPLIVWLVWDPEGRVDL